jgi:predicted metal-dependent phosphoesterase TrpH
MRCDLHMHSRCSDGSLEVESLVDAVHAAGVSVFALTDHDTLMGLPRARARAQALGIELIPGVEISTRIGPLELHILGYGFDPENAELKAALKAQGEAREDRIPRIVERLQSLGLDLSVEDVYRQAREASSPARSELGSSSENGEPRDSTGRPHVARALTELRSSIGRPHVARALIAKGYVRDTDEAFKRYLGDGGPAQIRKAVPEPKTAIAWLHAAGGKAVWAHPLARPIQRPGGFELLLRELASQGLDGVEEVHPAQDPGARRRIRKLARTLGLHLTGGSDFHGDATPDVALGVGRGHDEVPVSVIEALLR